MLNKSVNDCSEAVRVQKDFARDLLWHFVDLVQIVRRGTPGWLGVKPAVPDLFKSMGYDVIQYITYMWYKYAYILRSLQSRVSNGASKSFRSGS